MSWWHETASSRVRRPRPLVWAVLGAGLVAAPGQAAITGVCPDGSMFIVQSAEAIPCPEAKRVSPHELPPLKPEYLPRPYGWQQHQQRHDPNSPYNLIDSVRRERAARQPQAVAASGGAAASTGQPQPGGAQQPSSSGRPARASRPKLVQSRAPAGAVSGGGTVSPSAGPSAAAWCGSRGSAPDCRRRARAGCPWGSRGTRDSGTARA